MVQFVKEIGLPFLRSFRLLSRALAPSLLPLAFGGR